MMRRLWTHFSLILVLAMLISACVTPSVPTTPDSGEETGETPVETTSGPAELHIAWPYQAPPTGHFNTFVTNGLNLNFYQALMEPPLFWYTRATEEYVPMAATAWEWLDETTIQVTLREGAVWSDGSAFTSQDVVDTFDIARLQSLTVWNLLESVEAVDDHTVQFVLGGPSTIWPRRILREMFIRASSTYGEFAQRLRDLVADGATSEDAEWVALLQEFNEYRPEDMVVLGAFKIDPESITESQMTLNKVETSFMADWIAFDRIINYNGETPDVTPLVLALDVDYATHGFPPATERQFEAEGIRIIRAPLFTGPALYFNHDIYPLNVKEFRQAIAHAIDRNENGVVSLGASGVATDWMVGFSDNLVDIWLTEETKSAINHYEFNRETAEQILLDLGFSRGGDGNWVDDQGNALSYTLTAPAEFADWSAAAENLAQQLTDFGIPTTFRGINFQQHPIDMRAGDFELAIQTWGNAFPHPQFSFNTDFNDYNYTGGAAAATTGPGMNFPLTQETEALGEVNIEEMVVQAGVGGDIDSQRGVVNELALIYNELLPQIPLWERYGNNPVPDVRVTGWPEDGDPIYQNGPYGDAFIISLLIDGTLQPAQ